MRIRFRNSFALALGALVLNSVAAQPATSGSSSLVGPMSQFRKLHTATLLSNGKVLVAGGAPFVEAGAFQFTFRNTPGLGFTVLSTTDLAARVDNWTSLGIAAEVSPGHYQFTDLPAAQRPATVLPCAFTVNHQDNSPVRCLFFQSPKW